MSLNPITIALLIRAAAIGDLQDGSAIGADVPEPACCVQEITVIGLPGDAMGSPRAIRRLNAADIQAYGANNIADLANALESETRGNRGGTGAQIVLLNGNRIADFSEISNLPAEAVARIDILPEEVALSYGYPVGNRVLNIVLRDRFRSATSELGVTTATGGGRNTITSDSSFASIRGSNRFNLDLTIAHDDALGEIERDLPDADARTLLPSITRISFGGSLSTPIFDRVTASGSSRISTATNRAVLGTSADGVLQRATSTVSGRISSTLSGDISLWRWAAEFSGDGSTYYVTDDVALGGRERRPTGRISYESSKVGMLLTATGPLWSLPAGQIVANISVGYDSSAFLGRLVLPSAPRSFIQRRTAMMGGNFDVPITPAGSFAGATSIYANLMLTSVSGFGTISRLGSGVRWAPHPALSLSMSYLYDQGVPTLLELGEPVLVTPNLRVFDQITGETVEVTRLDGGSLSLGRNVRQERKVEMFFRLGALPNFALSANYTEVDLSNPIATFPITNPVLEAALPGRFVRDPAGRLIAIDARTTTVSSSSFRGLRWGFQYSAQRQLPNSARRIQLSAFHTWRFRNTIHITQAGPVLDLLEGSATGTSGGLPRHLIEAQAAIFTRGIGLRGEATWQTATSLRTFGPGTRDARDLTFSRRPQVNLRAFFNLSEFAGQQAPGWLRAGRISLVFDNVLASRTRARDAAGATPLAYDPRYLDPLGPSLRISFRTILS